MKKLISKSICMILISFLILPLNPQIAHAATTSDGFEYTVSGSYAAIIGYSGSSGSIQIPTTIGGYTVNCISSGAFGRSTNLTDITIPNSVTSIGSNAFWECSNLLKITIPNSVTSIGDYAFSGCSSLANITLPNSITSIGKGAFECCAMTSVVIPNSITSISSSMFRNTKLENVTIPNNVTTIGSGAFEGTNLTSVSIPNSVTTIGSGAFERTNLTSVSIPNSVTSIGPFAFGYCTSLTEIDVSLENSSYSSINGILYDKLNTTLICYPSGRTGSFSIPNGITSIGNSSFSGSNLISVAIPSSVKTIGDSAFSGSKLTSLTIPNNVTSIGDGAFSDSKLTNITIPNSITSIGNRTFEACINLTNVTIPNSVTSIGDGAFRYCSDLKNVTIPSSVTSIGNGAFFSCISMTSAIFLGNAPTIGSSVFDSFETVVKVYYLKGMTGFTNPWHGYTTIQVPLDVLASSSRYSTAVEISKASYSTASTVILATGANFPDALVAGPLAFQETAPILLTQTTALPQATIDELVRLKTAKVIIMGSESVVGQAVVSTLNNLGITVERVSGVNRFGTAVETARKVRAKSGVTDKAILATGYNFPDALSIGSYASKSGIPILLSSADTLPDVTKNALTEFGIKEIVIVGGYPAISLNVENQLISMGITVTRSSGSNRFATSVGIAKTYLPTSTKAVVATGRNFPDALAAVPYAAKMNAPLILVEQGSVPAEVSSYLLNSSISDITVVGGDPAVGQTTKNQLIDLLIK